MRKSGNKMEALKTIKFFLIAFAFLCGCQNQTKREIEKENKLFNQKINFIDEEKFEAFENKFFSDSAFQMNRIKFPLRGMDTEYVFAEEDQKDTIADNFFVKDKKFYWTEKKWNKIINVYFPKNEYTIEFKKDKKYVQKTIKSNTENFIIYFEFTLINKKWYLNYYSSEWY
jgi:hypothetical protein